MGVIVDVSLDTGLAIAFVRGQGTALRHGLEHAFDAGAVAQAACDHEAAHGYWLTLIAAAERDLGPAASGRIAGLYGFHGRVVECLERGSDRRLGAEVVREVHLVLARCLDDLTDHAVEAIRRAGALSEALAGTVGARGGSEG